MTHLSDKSLLVASDEQHAFRVLYDRYWESLYKKAFHRLGSSADAQDAVQEVFISLWRNKSHIEIKETLLPYLYTAIKYCIIKKIYRNERQGLLSKLSASKLEEEQKGTTAQQMLEYKELEGIIEQNVCTLPNRMQEIYRLSRNERLKTAEIAERLNISEQTVKNSLTTALKKLRHELAHYAKSFFYLY